MGIELLPISSKNNMSTLIEKARNAKQLLDFKWKFRCEQSTMKRRPPKKQTVKEKATLYSPLLSRRRHKRVLMSIEIPGRRPFPPPLTRWWKKPLSPLVVDKSSPPPAVKISPPSLAEENSPPRSPERPVYIPRPRSCKRPRLEKKESPPALVRRKPASHSPETPVYISKPRSCKRSPLMSKDSPPRSPGTPINNPRRRTCVRSPLVWKKTAPPSPAKRVYSLRPRPCRGDQHRSRLCNRDQLILDKLHTYLNMV